MSGCEEKDHSEENNVSRKFTVFPYQVEPNSQDYFSWLSNEVILEIFTFLSFQELRLYSLVCKRWYSISLDVKLWKNVTLLSRELKISSLERILNCGVKFMELERLAIIEEEVCGKLILSEKFDNLQHLSIVNTKVSKTLLEKLLASLPHLKVFILEYSCNMITCNAFKYMNKMKLEKLHLSECCITATAVQSYEPFIKLEHLKLHYFVDVEALIHICPNLKSLSLHGFHMNSTVITEIVQMKHLQKLRLSFANVEECRDRRILNILENCDNINELHCLSISRFNFYMHLITLQKLLLRCNFLTELELNAIDLSVNVYETVFTMQHLQKLCFWQINTIIQSSSTVSHILRNYKAFPNLTYLGISFKCFESVSYEVEILMHLSPHLKFLHLENFDLNDTIYELLYTLTELDTLLIYNGSSIPLERVSAIFKNCPKLVNHNLNRKMRKIENL